MFVCGIAVLQTACWAATASQEVDFSPTPEERQLTTRMHSAMKDLPLIRVGHADADLIGGDHRALQAAVDYVAGLGGGIVEIGPGEYLMRDSLHQRSARYPFRRKGIVLRTSIALGGSPSLMADSP